MTEPVFGAFGPVYELRGKLAPGFERDTVSLTVAETTDGLRSFEVVLHGKPADPKYPTDAARYLDRVEIDFGTEIKAYLGPDSAQAEVFDGIVSSIEVVHRDGLPPLVVVCAEDRLMRLRMTRHMRSYTDVTDADLVEDLASAHGLQADATAQGPRYDIVQQLNQSDLAFLRERARLIQAELWCTGQTVHFATRDQRRPGELELIMGNHLLEVRVAADLAHQRSSVTVTGYDAFGQQVIDERAGDDVVTAEVPAGVIGSKLVGAALGAGGSYRVREGAIGSKEARAFADAEMLRRGRQFVTARGTIRGNAAMTVGTRVTLAQVGPIFEGGDYYVTSVRHTHDLDVGFRTRFEAERAYVPEVPR
jgi:uncharacterized protein